MTITGKYKASKAIEARSTEIIDIAGQLDIGLVGYDWDWDEIEEHDDHIIVDSAIFYCTEEEDDDPDCDFTVRIPESIIRDVLASNQVITDLQSEFCRKEWDRIKDKFLYHKE